MISAFISFALAALISLGLVPVASRLAGRVGLVDKPDNTRKLHKTAIPLVGGIVVFISICVASLVTFWGVGTHFEPIDRFELLGLFLSCCVLVVIGVLDDRFVLRGRQKLAGQILAVSVLIGFGYRFDQVDVLRFEISFGVFSVLVVYGWCLIAINSVNLLDGADGFASTIGLIVSTSLSIMAFWVNLPIDGIICLTIAGALAGFLYYNFPPAKAYLGDAGSMLIGLLLAAISIRCTFKQQLAYAVFAPIALLAIPLIDTSAAIIRRRFTGRSIYTEDRGHLHHILAKKGLSPVGSLLWVAALCLMTAAGGTISLIMHQAEYALASIVMVIIVMVAGKIFGVAEYKLLSQQVISLAKSFLMLPNRNKKDGVQESSIQLQGNRDWQEIWGRLSEFAQEHELNQIMLDVNAPWMHEGFHATWKKSKAKTSGSHQWLVEIPMVVSGKILGRINVFGAKDCRFSHHDIIINLLKVTQDIETILNERADLSGEIRVDLPQIAAELSKTDAPDGSITSAR